MSIIFENKYIQNTLIDDPIVSKIFIIVSYIKSNNYPEAYNLMTELNLSFSNITSKTQTLKDIELVRFIDFCAKQKGLMWMNNYH